MRYVIFRGRFQPFTRVHYKCVRLFFTNSVLTKDSDPEAWPWLILCIVRDYEALASEHSLLSKNTEPKKFFRHLFLFNPFSALQCEREIHEGFLEYLDEEQEDADKEDSDERKTLIKNLRKFIRTRVLVKTVPTKFQDLISSLRMDTINDPSLLATRDRIVDVFSDPKDDGNLRSARRLVTMLLLFSNEQLSLDNAEMEWLVPVFDLEDLTDLMLLKKEPKAFFDEFLFAGDAYVLTPALQPFITHEKRKRGLSVVGAFIYYAYLRWLQEPMHNLPRPSYPKITSEDVQLEMENVLRFLKPYARSRCITSYQECVGKRATFARYSLTLTKTERDILKDPLIFFELAWDCLAVPGKEDIEAVNEEITLTQEKEETEVITTNRRIFISYSHKDEKNGKWLTKLKSHLGPLERVEKLSVWDDTRIKTGAEWQVEINQGIASTKVAVLLVTQNFLNSDFIHKGELEPFFAAAERGDLTLFPIAVRKSHYDEFPRLKKLMFANDPDRPLSVLRGPELDDALVEISKKIARALEQ